ncbi:hypothetical protein PVAP13_2NG048250 [Panicum virgatum]|uniref:Uncharacterized protein n=1 Tax=Panicum virgatum TaxID=38727 RepID=A0A8T0VBP0_PANVG|nr:hypothetical protein PVAP13_2NG048250 [Panicum virgatum]
MRPDPLASHHIATRRTRHEVPRPVGKKSRVLLFHRATPVRIRQGVADRGGYRKDPRLSLGGGESRGLRRHPPSHHGMDMPRIPMDDGRVVHRRLGSRGSRWRRRRRQLRWRRRRSFRSRRRRRCRHRTTPVHLHRLSVPRRRRCRRRTTPGHLHRLSVPRRCRERHRGRAWRSRRHRVRARHDRRSGGRTWRDCGHWGRARRSRDHREQCQCTGKTCRERTDRKRWLNHRVSRKQRLQLGVRRRCGGGGVGEIRLVKDDVSGDQDAARGEVKASVPLVVRGVTKKHTTSRAGR